MSKLISKYLKGKHVLSEEMYNKIGHTQIPILVKQILDKYRDIDEYSFDDILSKHPDLSKYLNNIQLDYARAYYDESKKRRNFKRDIAITNTPEAQKILNPEINPEEIDRQFATAEKNRELRAKEIQDWRLQQWAENVLRGYGYSEEKLKNPNIKAHAIALANNLIKREEAGKQYMKTVVGGTVGLMGAPYLVTTSIPTLVAVGGGIVGGKAVDKGTNLISKNKYEGWGDMVSDKLTGNKESGWLFDFTNPGYFAGGFAGNRLVTGNFGRGLAFSANVNKGIRDATLDRYIKFGEDNLNQNVRFKLGDVEINNPNLFYRQGDGPLAKDLIESGIVRTMDSGKKQIIGTLNLTKPTQSNAMFNKGKVAFSPESDMGKNLIVTSASNKMNPTQPKTWTGNAVYINNWRSNPITKQEATAYIFEPGHGYRNANTLNLNNVLNTKISLSHTFPKKYINDLFNSKHLSLIIPSTSDIPVGWGGYDDNVVLFLKNNVMKKYPHQSYKFDGQSTTVSKIFGENANLKNYTKEELNNILNKNLNIIKKSQFPNVAKEVSDDERVFVSRLKEYLADNNTNLTPLFDPLKNYSEVHFHSLMPVEDIGGAFINDENLLPYFKKFNIKTNLDFPEMSLERVDLDAFRKWITNSNNKVGFREGGKL